MDIKKIARKIKKKEKPLKDKLAMVGLIRKIVDESIEEVLSEKIEKLKEGLKEKKGFDKEKVLKEIQSHEEVIPHFEEAKINKISAKLESYRQDHKGTHKEDFRKLVKKIDGYNKSLKYQTLEEFIKQKKTLLTLEDKTNLALKISQKLKDHNLEDHKDVKKATGELVDILVSGDMALFPGGHKNAGAQMHTHPTYATGGIDIHNLLSATHPDTTPAAVIRGDLVTGQGVPPTWSRLPLGAAQEILKSDGTDALWTAYSAKNFDSLTAGSVLFASATGFITEDNNNFFWDDANNRLGIGTTTPAYDLDVVGGGRFIGGLAVGNLATVIPNSPVYIYHTFNTNADNRGLTATIRQIVPSTAPNYPATLRFEMNYYGIGVQAYRLAGIYGSTQVMAGATNVDGARGIQGTVRHRSNSAVTSALGGRCSIEMSGGGTLALAANFGVSNLNITAGTITNLAGLWVENPIIGGTGAVTNFFGIYLPNFVGPGTAWGIYQVGTNDNYFCGNIQIRNRKELRFYDNGNYVGFEAPNLVANQIWVLPTADGTAGEVPTTDGAGTLSWTAKRAHFGFANPGDINVLPTYMIFQGVTGSATAGGQPARSGSVTGIAVNVQLIIGVGLWQCRFEVYINGVASGLSVDFFSTDAFPAKKSVTQAIGTDAIAADDILTIVVSDVLGIPTPVATVTDSIGFIEVYYD